MLNIKTILLPVDFPNTSLRVIHQAAALAHHFHSEIVMLHVVKDLSQAAGVPKHEPELAGWNMLAEIIRGAQKNLNHSLGSELGFPSDVCWPKVIQPKQLCSQLNRKKPI